jgi:trans-aconitate methyltransferase
MNPPLHLYTDLAGWFHLLTSPADYAEEAAFYRERLLEASQIPVRTLLELGSGGGNNASHLKAHFQLTLVDLSPDMLAVSRTLNPECEHLQGDMRTVRVGREFDAVLIHDAIMYMVSKPDLRAAFETAFVHLKPGGAALFAPDCTRETFRSTTEHGGHDGQGRALRYLEWSWDPDPGDTTFVSEMVYLLREGGQVRVEHDRHIEGLFQRQQWLDWLAEAGFEPRAIPFVHSEIEPGTMEVFVGVKG